MKRQVYYALAVSRRWANTPKGERIIVQLLTSISALGLACGVLLAIGFII